MVVVVGGHYNIMCCIFNLPNSGNHIKRDETLSDLCDRTKYYVIRYTHSPTHYCNNYVQTEVWLTLYVSYTKYNHILFPSIPTTYRVAYRTQTLRSINLLLRHIIITSWYEIKTLYCKTFIIIKLSNDWLYIFIR